MASEIPDGLIVDASILFSFFSSSSARRDVFKKLLNHGTKLASPAYASTELSNNKSKIMKFSQIDDSKFDEIFSELNKELDTVNESEYKEFLPEAGKISPHGKEETKDDPYFALSLFLNKTPIWSDEEAFKNQSSVEIFTTNRLDRLLRELDKSKELPEMPPSELRKLFEKDEISDEDPTELIRKMRGKKYDW